MKSDLYHVLGAKQFDREELQRLFALSEEMEALAEAGGDDRWKNKIMVNLFFEPSTRTRLSFEAAMCRLGGQVIGTENAAQFSSAIKGETLEDTIRILSSYGDMVVMRHTEIGAAERAAAYAEVPLINAGDGAGEHPTQALLDIYTIQKELGQVDNLHIGFVGDLTFGRTVHSLSYLLANYRDVTLYYTSPENVVLPTFVKKYLEDHNIRFVETSDLREVAKRADVIYQTRIQKERFPSIEEYEKAAGKYIIDASTMELLQDHAIILHPLPRAGEIDVAVDQDPRAAYFRQARNGLYVRMALIERCLSGTYGRLQGLGSANR